MEIFMPMRLRPTGGTSTFARKFADGMRARGHQVFFKRPRRYDLLLVNAACPPQWIIQAKWHKRPIVHRLDGVWYPLTSAGWRWRWHNLPLAWIRGQADRIIYQSEYSRHCAEIFLGKSAVSGRVVYNGVDTRLFSEEGEKNNLRDQPNQPLFITASRFRRGDQIDPMIEGFRIFRRQGINAKLVVIGNFEGAVRGRPSQYQQPGGIEFLGTIANQELPKFLRGADVFLFTHLNPPCPNNVIEALACGLPVCGMGDGAMPELIQEGKSGKLISVPGDGFRRRRRPDLEAWAKNLRMISEQRQAYSKNARQQAIARFDLEKMLDAYEEVFRELT